MQQPEHPTSPISPMKRPDFPKYIEMHFFDQGVTQAFVTLAERTAQDDLEVWAMLAELMRELEKERHIRMDLVIWLPGLCADAIWRVREQGELERRIAREGDMITALIGSAELPTRRAAVEADRQERARSLAEQRALRAKLLADPAGWELRQKALMAEFEEQMVATLQ